MSIVGTFTREQWEHNNGWRGVEPWVDGVILLFREEDYAEDDILPRVIRLDPATGYLPYPEDIAEPLPLIPYRYYKKADDGNGWEFQYEGADTSAHQQVGTPRPEDPPQ